MSDNKLEGNMLPLRLRVRCFAEHKGSIWQAFSLELGLAAQGESLAEVKSKLQAMIESYVREAVTIDKDHALELLSRSATWEVYARYHVYSLATACRKLARMLPALVSNPFREKVLYSTAMPLAPCA